MFNELIFRASVNFFNPVLVPSAPIFYTVIEYLATGIYSLSDGTSQFNHPLVAGTLQLNK